MSEGPARAAPPGGRRRKRKALRLLSAAGALGIVATLGWVSGCGAGPEADRATTPPAGDTGEGPRQAGGGLPALVVDEEAPLLVDEPSDAGQTLASGTINEACFVCHANYREEPLVLWHAAEDIGCARCHGDSAAHRNDENNTTPPDVLYPPEAIGDACRKCHPTHDVAAEEVVIAWRKRGPEKREAAWVVCTDCHGRHRLKARAVRWDKRTGELLTGDGKPR